MPSTRPLAQTACWLGVKQRNSCRCHQVTMLVSVPGCGMLLVPQPLDRHDNVTQMSVTQAFKQPAARHVGHNIHVHRVHQYTQQRQASGV